MDHSADGLLIVDIDPAREGELKQLLASIGRRTVHTATPGEWRFRLEQEAGVRVVLLGACGGAEEQARVHAALREAHPNLPVVCYGGGAQADGAAEEGADAFVRALPLPLEPASLGYTLDEALRHAEAHPSSGRGPELFRSLIGRSEGIRKVRQLIQRVAGTDATVLVLGESGTGKEVVARNIHYHSARRGKPFVAVSCSGIPPALLEGELFGHGAGPAASAVHVGCIEQAAGGTLFLDEIGALSLAAQAKLLRVLQEGVYERAGGGAPLRADVRLTAAAPANLEREVREGAFREDLYYRLNVFPLVMPPLRERAEDVPLLIAEINARLRQERNAAVRLSPEALATLQRNAWPGNVRELANLIERLALPDSDAAIDVADLPSEYRAVRNAAAAPAAPGALPLPTLPPDGLKLKDYLGNIEYALIVQALTRTGGVVAHAAQLLGLRRTTLVEKLHKYGVRRETETPSPAPVTESAANDEAGTG